MTAPRTQSDELPAMPQSEEKRTRLQVRLLTSAWFVALVPIISALAIFTVFALKAQAESWRVAEIEAELASRWLTDRLRAVEPEERIDVLKKFNRHLNKHLSLLKNDGTPLLRGQLISSFSGKMDSSVAQQLRRRTINEESYVLSTISLGRVSSAQQLIVAARKPSISKFLFRLGYYEGAALLVCVVAALLMGKAYGDERKRVFEQFKYRILSMVEDRRSSTPDLQEHRGDKETSALLFALKELEERFRGELAIYQDAVDEVEALDEQRSVFLNSVAKDLKVPLERIIDEAQGLVLGKKDELDPAQAEDVKIILKAGYRLLGLADDIIDLSKLIAENSYYDDETIDLIELAEEVTKTGRGQIGEKDIAVKMEVAENRALCVRGNRRRLWQVLTNLVTNGIKFTDQGSITVRLGHTEKGEIKIEVIDTGMGVPAEAQQAIFDPFMQHGTRTKSLRGTGLGLAICKRLVELHRGEIQIVSKEGEGSRFIIVMPAA